MLQPAQALIDDDVILVESEDEKPALPNEHQLEQRKAAQPLIDDDVILVELEDEKPALPNEHQVEQCKDDPSLGASASSSDLLQRVEQLKWENDQLKEHLADRKFLSESISKVIELGKSLEQLLPERENRDQNNPRDSGVASADDSKLPLEQEDSPVSFSRKGRRNVPRKGQRKGLRKGLGRNPRMSGSSSTLDSGVCNDSSMVDIGNGVLVEEKQLGELFKSHTTSATKFGRSLLRIVFTPDELQGKCLLGRNSKGSAKQPLDHIRVRAVIDYTCSKFGVNKQRLRSSLSAMMYYCQTGISRPPSFR
ncbi:uncharacterized protein [Dermacentor albipictus]